MKTTSENLSNLWPIKQHDRHDKPFRQWKSINTGVSLVSKSAIGVLQIDKQHSTGDLFDILRIAG